MSLTLAGSGALTGVDLDALSATGKLSSDLLPAGSIIAVKHVLKTDTFVSGGVASGQNAAVTGLSITHEVANASNRLIISAYLGAAGTSHGRGNVGMAIHDGTGLIAVGNADGNRPRVGAGSWPQATTETANGFITTMPSVTFVHTPGTGSKTYTVRVINIISDNVTKTLYVNRTEDDSNNESRPRAASALVIQEVAV